MGALTESYPCLRFSTIPPDTSIKGEGNAKDPLPYISNHGMLTYSNSST